MFIHTTLFPICCCSVAQLCPTLFNPIDSSTPGFPLVHYLPEFAQTHVHWVNDVCHPPLLLPSIFPIISVFSNESALPIRWPKYWSFDFSTSLPMNIQSWFPLELTALISLLSMGLSRVFSSTTIQKQQFLLWMWELNHKESWAQKNSCFWTVVLEKTLESPLDWKEIKTVYPKGNQPCIVIGRPMLKLKLQ